MKNKTKIILILSVIILLATVLGGCTNGSLFGGADTEKKYTYKELKEMPAEDLYQLFLDEGLKLPEHYKDATKEEMAEYMKSNFDKLSQGWIVASATVHQEFAKQVKAIYDDITYPPGTRVIEYVNEDGDQKQEGYILELNIDKVPLSEISGQVNEVKDTLVHQHANHNSLSSTSPDYWKKDFSASSEALEYIGLKSLRGLDWDLEETNISLTIYGNEKGEFQRLSTEAWYQVGEIRMQAITSIYTNINDEQLTLGCYTNEDIDIFDMYFSTDNHYLYHIVSQTAMENGIKVMDGYLVFNGILYNLHVSYTEEDSQQALELVQKWANLIAAA